MVSEGTLLLIEDDEQDISLFMEAAKQLGFDNKMVIVRDGEEALEFIKENSVKLFLILCDMNMPKMTGMELKKELENSAATHKKSIPFVFFSTGKDEDTLVNAYNLGAQGYFLKGDSYKEYVEKLQTIIKYWDFCEHPGSVKDKSKEGIA